MGLQLKFWLNLALAAALLLAPTGAGARPQQASGTASDDGWVIETVDSANDVGRYSSLALNPANDFPRISYYDATAGNLKYAAWDGIAWQIDIVDSAGDVGQYSSLALDPVSGAPRIAYHDATNGDLKYATWTGTAWQITVVEDLGIAGSAGMDCSLAIEPTHGHPRISYRVYYPGTGSFARYASWNGVTWQFASNFGDGSNTGYYTSLALDPSSALPRISFQNRSWYDGDLMFAASDGVVWLTHTAVLTGNVGAFSSLALDPDTGQPRIAHYYANTNTIEYATWDGSNWSNSTLPFDSQGYCSLALDTTTGYWRGYPRIAHRSRNTTGGKLMYAAWDGATWQSQTVYDQAPVAYSSLRLDRVMGEPRIAFYDEATGDLKLATRRVPPSPSCRPGYFEAMSFGPDDLNAPSDPDIPYAFSVAPDQGSAGELLAWQGEGHFWDYNCNPGPNNDNGREPCDQGQDGEIIAFSVNDNHINQFVDHNPDDDRNFYYEWPLSDLQVGSNTLYLTNVPWSDSVFYRGTVCVEQLPASVPLSPECGPGYVRVRTFGPDDLNAPSDPDITYTFNVASGLGPAGKLLVWQGEGHYWDESCNQGPNNDNGRYPCDQGQTGEIIGFSLNDNPVGQFIDHHPDDDRNFYYEWPLSSLNVGTNTLYLTNDHDQWGDSVFYRGTVCVQSTPLAISLARFEAVAQANDILLRWETVSEFDNTGFNIYRADEVDGERTVVAFVPSQAPGSGQGFAYEWPDSDVTAGETYHYWLEDIDTSGATSLHGPVSATFQAPSAVTVDGVQAAAGGYGVAGWWVFAGVLALLAGIGMFVKRR